jgi:hypothetical protein
MTAEKPKHYVFDIVGFYRVVSFNLGSWHSPWTIWNE